MFGEHYQPRRKTPENGLNTHMYATYTYKFEIFFGSPASFWASAISTNSLKPSVAWAKSEAQNQIEVWKSKAQRWTEWALVGMRREMALDDLSCGFTAGVWMS